MNKIKIRRERSGGLMFTDTDGSRVKLNSETMAEVTPEFLETDRGKFLMRRGDFKLTGPLDVAKKPEPESKVQETPQSQETVVVPSSDPSEDKKEPEQTAPENKKEEVKLDDNSAEKGKKSSNKKLEETKK